KAALKQVSKQRSDLGAVQNRLEHTIKNLDNVVENTTSAESAIRDTDMASEMVKFSNNNILAQAGQSMLAQANQSNQGVLSLL
ncbi:MAG: flagellin, partial [Firmicutes bacterium]|nr:flagellin [Bacillota bacterium]